MTLAATAPFTILTVCTGNLCRSPFAAAAFARAFEGDPDVRVVSAGTHAVDGEVADPDTASVAAAHGLDLSGHRARSLTPAVVSSADLILTMSKEHRAAAVMLFPRANRRAFTLLEFAALAQIEDDLDGLGVPVLAASPKAEPPIERLRAAVARVGSRRGSLPLHDPSADTVPDPHRLGLDVHDRMARTILAAVDPAVRPLAEALGDR